MTLIYLGLVVATVLFFVGMGQLGASIRDRRRLARGVVEGMEREVAPGSPFTRADRRFTRTRVGRYLQRELSTAGLNYPPLGVAAVLLVVGIVLPYLLSVLFAPVFAVFGVLVVFLILRLWLSRQRERRLERLVQQIPELARVLSNGTNAGLSIATAWTVAEREMYEPAKSEIRRLNDSVRFGSSLETAMLELYERHPAREIRVLMSTLVVSARSGGSLVKALRDISRTLDDRKEVRREIRTTLAQARVTSWLVAAMAVGMLVMLNAVQPGTVEKMTGNLIGQIALVVGFGLIAVGLLIVRRLTRIDV
ncbi:type II secretion system F family protein [Naumannella huperziae]